MPSPRGHRRTRRLVAALTLSPLVVAACGDDDDGASADTTTAATVAPAATAPSTDGATADQPAPEEFAAVATTYADLVAAEYGASIASATELQTAIEAFIASPTDATLQAAKDQWVDARQDYLITEPFRFYDGPIDDPENGPEGQINAWPMDEAYVDYVDGDAEAGIVNNTTDFPEITTDVLVAANEEGGETNISTGWHAIEFLLWGQDLSETGPGARPVTDYTEGANADRRATYLGLVTDLLVADLESVAAEWAEDGAYRATFLEDPVDAVQKIMRGIGALSAGELAGERISVALDTKDQEDEHSCFSDTTNQDVFYDAEGIRIVYEADFEGVTGTSLSDLVAMVDPALDEQLRTEIEASVALAEAFPETFETMIAAPEDDPAAQALVAARNAIEQQGTTIADAAAALGLEISITV